MTTEQEIAYIAIDVRVADALERIATALEQGILEGIAAPTTAGPQGDPYGDLPFPTDEITDLPPVRPILSQTAPVPQPNLADVCPIHKTPWKTVPAGVSKKTGNPYNAFRACSVAGCDQRPRL